jgi:hypothetical protein
MDNKLVCSKCEAPIYQRSPYVDQDSIEYIVHGQSYCGRCYRKTFPDRIRKHNDHGPDEGSNYRGD